MATAADAAPTAADASPATGTPPPPPVSSRVPSLGPAPGSGSDQVATVLGSVLLLVALSLSLIALLGL